MQTLAQYKGGWSVIGEPDHTFIAVAYGEDQTIAPNLAWDLSAEDDTEDRDTMFGELLDVLVNGTTVTTDSLDGIAFAIPDQYDWTLGGRARAIYKLTSEDTGKVYYDRADDLDTLLSAMRDYTDEPEATEE